jgi:hypothetical protein
MVDLRTCKPGDKLRSCHGMILEYVGLVPYSNGKYPHCVKYPDGTRGTLTNNGQVFKTARLPEDHDIVEIIPNSKTRKGAE